MIIEQQIEKALKKRNILTQNTTSSWRPHSQLVAQYCPQHFDPNKYNWELHSWAVARFNPKNLDPEKYNWVADSDTVIKYCPEKLDINKANLRHIRAHFPKYNNMSLGQIKKQAILNKL